MFLCVFVYGIVYLIFFFECVMFGVDVWGDDVVVVA